jgi:hypothetical protein
VKLPVKCVIAPSVGHLEATIPLLLVQALMCDHAAESTLSFAARLHKCVCTCAALSGFS